MLKDILHGDTALDAAGSCCKLNMLEARPRIQGGVHTYSPTGRHPWVGSVSVSH